MSKLISLFACLIFVFILSACGNSSSDAAVPAYEINHNTYQDDNPALNQYVHIEYPQINGLHDTDLENEINRQLKDIMFNDVYGFTSLAETEIKTEYFVALSNSNFLSVRFNIWSFHTAQAYPLIRNFTANYDLQTGARLKLRDMIEINEDFADTFLSTFQNNREYTDEETSERINLYVQRIISNDTFANCDEDFNRDFCSFLKEDSLVISIAVPHASGSFALYEADYSQIQSILLLDIPN